MFDRSEETNSKSEVERYMPVSSALWKLKQEYPKFKGNVGYILRFCRSGKSEQKRKRGEREGKEGGKEIQTGTIKDIMINTEKKHKVHYVKNHVSQDPER